MGGERRAAGLPDDVDVTVIGIVDRRCGILR